MKKPLATLVLGLLVSNNAYAIKFTKCFNIDKCSSFDPCRWETKSYEVDFKNKVIKTVIILTILFI